MRHYKTLYNNHENDFTAKRRRKVKDLRSSFKAVDQPINRKLQTIASFKITHTVQAKQKKPFENGTIVKEEFL